MGNVSAINNLKNFSSVPFSDIKLFNNSQKIKMKK